MPVKWLSTAEEIRSQLNEIRVFYIAACDTESCVTVSSYMFPPLHIRSHESDCCCADRDKKKEPVVSEHTIRPCTIPSTTLSQSSPRMASPPCPHCAHGRDPSGPRTTASLAHTKSYIGAQKVSLVMGSDFMNVLVGLRFNYWSRRPSTQLSNA